MSEAKFEGTNIRKFPCIESFNTWRSYNNRKNNWTEALQSYNSKTSFFF